MIKNAKYKIIAISFFSAALISSVSFLVNTNEKDFHPNKITINRLSGLSFETKKNEEENNHLNCILNQDFFYLGSGSQSYAFVSQDQKYVLKFIKMKHLNPKPWLKTFGLFLDKDFIYKKTLGRLLKFSRLMNNLKVTYNIFKDEAGLIDIHLQPTLFLNKQVKVFDKKGKQWLIDPNKYLFIVQNKAELIYSRLDNLIQQNRQDCLRETYLNVLEFIFRRAKKNLIDLDKGVQFNYGFVGERVIQIDIGRLQNVVTQNDSNCLDQVAFMAEKIDSWLRKKNPELANDLLLESKIFISLKAEKEKINA